MTESVDVEEAFAFLREKGHEITFDWTALPHVKPYADNVKTATQFAKEGIDGVLQADVYILIPHQDGHGIYVELGAALVAYEQNGSPQVYVVGPEREVCMFHFHLAVKYRNLLADVWQELGV